MSIFTKIFKPGNENHKVVSSPDILHEKTKMSTVMSEKVKFSIDGKECTADKGLNLVEAAIENGVYIPTLCHL